MTQFERDHVHDVYDHIADAFSQTRYKPWPVIDRFLNTYTAKPGTLVADIGCGNGKYISSHRQGVFYQASDRSQNLLSLCTHKHPECCDGIQADTLKLPYTSACMDVCLSVAVLHHLSSHGRRVEAVREMLRVLRPQGHLLVYVWAFEQGLESKLRGSRVRPVKSELQLEGDMANMDEMTEADVYVQWKSKDGSDTRWRYYHLFKQNELQMVVRDAGIEAEIVEEGYDKDNWYIILRKR
jgi:tRNA (uracil-5-)-methyltransferase TRM9